MSDQKLELNEITILGNIMLDSGNDAMLTTAQHLFAEDFTDPRNAEIFKVMLELNKDNRVCNLAMVAEGLRNAKKLDEIGGMDYLDEIINSCVTIGPVDTYINSVKERSLLINFINKLKTISYEAEHQPVSNVSEFIGKAEQDILAITQQRRVEQAMKLSDINDDLVRKLIKQTDDFKERGVQANGVTGIPTGYSEMDSLTKGWHKGDMVIIGARPSVGKTAFALNLLYNVARKGTPVIFFSLEMSAVSIAMRLLELTSTLTGDQINSLSYLHDSRKEKIQVSNTDSDSRANVHLLQRGLDELTALPFYIDDNPGSQMIDIATKCKKLKNQIPNVGLIAIDYLSLITSPSKSTDNRQQEVANISRQIKQLARQLEVPIIALCQLSRDSEKRDNHEPQISDIRESGSIEQDADMIFMIYRQDYYTQQKGTEDDSTADAVKANDSMSETKVKLVKNRNGQTGRINFIFDKQYCKFSVASDQPEPEGV